jgi:hypothetical protein
MSLFSRRKERAQGYPQGIARPRRVRLHAFTWLISLALLSALIIPALVYAHGVMFARTPAKISAASRPLPADLFIQSVVKDDGALGWHQLCPTVQTQLPLSALMQQAETQRQDAAQHGLRLTSVFVGARPRSTGGELRIYVLTAHWSNGATEQRTYSVLTQASGCVEDVTSQ